MAEQIFPTEMNLGLIEIFHVSFLFQTSNEDSPLFYSWYYLTANVYLMSV